MSLRSGAKLRTGIEPWKPPLAVNRVEHLAVLIYLTYLRLELFKLSSRLDCFLNGQQILSKTEFIINVDDDVT